MKKFLVSASMIILAILAAPTTSAINSESIQSVVQLYSYNTNDEFYYTGTGFLISNDALILTAAHVLTDDEGNPLENIDICFVDSAYSIPECRYSGEVIATEPELDLALIAPAYELDEKGMPTGNYLTVEAMQEKNLPYIDLADYTPELGDELTILGFPAASLNPTITLTQGTVSGFTPFSFFDPTFEEDLIFAIQTDAVINQGNSGGPAYNEDEKVVGVVSSISIDGATGGGNYGYIANTDTIWLWFWSLVEDDILNEEFVSNAFSNDYIEENPFEYYDWENIDIESNQEIFTDVTPQTKNAQAIFYLKTMEIAHGYPDGSFKPFSGLNRAEFLKMVTMAMAYDPDISEYNNCFPDVKDEWFAPYVCLAKENNWVTGYSDGKFRPNQKVNKAEAIRMLLEVFEIPLETAEDELLFKDTPKNQWYTPYIATAKYYDLLEEKGDNFYPAKDILRGQMSENIYRTLLTFPLGE